jgi:hypothetical protein
MYKLKEQDMVAHTCNLSTVESEAERPPFGGQPCLHTGTLSQKKYTIDSKLYFRIMHGNMATCIISTFKHS